MSAANEAECLFLLKTCGSCIHMLSWPKILKNGKVQNYW